MTDSPLVRPLRADDAEAVRTLFAATAAAGRPLRLPPADLTAYTDLCLGWYLDIDGAACAVVEEQGRVTGYAMVALDHAAYARWAQRQALRWAARALVRMPLAPAGAAARFHRRRVWDGARTAAARVRHPMPAHFHFNVEATRRGGVAGYMLAGHADRAVGQAGLPGYFGEVNVPVGKPGRERALRRLGATVVHRQRNHTLSWLAGQPVERLTVVRSLDPTDGWIPLPHTG